MYNIENANPSPALSENSLIFSRAWRIIFANQSYEISGRDFIFNVSTLFSWTWTRNIL